jgi:hypothetical protein
LSVIINIITSEKVNSFFCKCVICSSFSSHLLSSCFTSRLESTSSFNPFRQAFNLLIDEELSASDEGKDVNNQENDIEMLNTKSYSSALSVFKIHVNFTQVIEMIAK